jgi:hypothetical protein
MPVHPAGPKPAESPREAASDTPSAHVPTAVALLESLPLSIDLCLACAAGLCRLATGHLLQLFGVSSALYRDLRGGTVDVTEIAGREFD